MRITSKQIKQAEMLDRIYSLSNDWEMNPQGKLEKITPEGKQILINFLGMVEFKNI